MKQLISRIKLIARMVVWDLVTAAALFFLLFIAVDRIDTQMMKVLAVAGACAFVLLMLVLKYQMLYKLMADISFDGEETINSNVSIGRLEAEEPHTISDVNLNITQQFSGFINKNKYGKYKF